MALAFRQGKSWLQLLEHRYVVVLGEAGTGKSTEFESQADALVMAGRAAFFVELNDLAEDGLVGSLDPDDEERLHAWRKTKQHAVFFLDSLDEAKLQRHSLHQALRKLRKELKDEWQRVQLTISCRVSDWWADADRSSLEEVIPKDSNEKVYVVQIAPLDEDQVARLVAHIGVTDVGAFMIAIKESHAQVFVERPLDVEWLGTYWMRQHRIGSLRELVADNINEKLQERATRRSTLPRSKAEKGIRALAGIATLTRRHSFLVPDEQHDIHRAASAINPNEVLADWSNEDIQQLLRLPIFDESTYGRVRIHHRSVQEYLAAKWLVDLSDAGLARSKLEELLFREEAGQRVIPEHLGPVVAWFSLWDASLREKLVREAPVLLLAHGDPSGLSVDERSNILRNYAHSYTERKHLFDRFEQASLDRFASPALANTIIDLLSAPDLPEELTAVLLQIVEHGRIVGCVPSALRLALTQSCSEHVRFFAIRAVGIAGNKEHREQLLPLIETTENWEQDVAGSFVRALYPDLLSIDGLLRVLSRVEPKRRYTLTSLQIVLENEIPASHPGQRLQLLQALMAFIGTTNENGKREIRHERAWLLRAAGKLLAATLDDLPSDSVHMALINVHMALVKDALELFRQRDETGLQTAAEHGVDEVREAVARHGEIRRMLFWQRVEAHRQRKGKTPTRYHELPYSHDIFELSANDEQWLTRDASERGNIRERLLAFDTLGWVLNIQEKLEYRLSQLQSIAAKDPVLRKRLERSMNRPAPNLPSMTKWQRINRARELRRKRQHDISCKALTDHIETIRDGTNSRALWFLWERTKQDETYSSTKAHTSLREQYGDKIADAALDGWRAFWRLYDPPLPHERKSRNTSPCGITLGLTGLSQDIQAGLDIANLDEALVVRAIRYAACELNSFPDWMGGIAEAHPKVVAQTLEAAISADYEHPDTGTPINDVLAKLARSHHSARFACASVLSRLLGVKEPPMVEALIETLSILLTTKNVDVAIVDAIAENRCRDALKNRRRFAVWWCAWIDRDGDSALDFLEKMLNESSPDDGYGVIEEICNFIHECDERFALMPIAAFKKVGALARLIPLVYGYITPAGDTHHEGAYSPGPRDNAQTVRSNLITWLADIPGTESTTALRKVAEDPRMAGFRDWLLHRADQRLVADLSKATPSVADALIGLFKQFGLDAVNNLGPLSHETMTKIHVGIITMKEEEYTALLEKLKPSATRTGGRRDYDIAEIQTPNGLCRVGITRCVQQGNTYAQTAATEMLADLSPAFMLVVGIGGGVPTPDFCLGDVVVSSYIQDLTLEDTGTDYDSSRFDALGGPLHPAASRIVERLRAIELDHRNKDWISAVSIGAKRPGLDGKATTDDEVWNADISDALARHAKRDAPMSTARKIASSDRLVKNPDLIKTWRTVSKGVVVVEMESTGVSLLCQRNNIPVLVIRGISDIVGWKRDEAWTVYACHTAAALTRMLIGAGLFCSESS
ncbi:hypothetical protein [Pyxidicoccus sp. MSG2]|uniref:phosphorylase family protein n=1 Tax=Pyxidicoccus sp. MSG2 TaxID=2996790 RepID=UPI00226E0866|nr:hypothetical protein [Pyxidicoccus sp. MSG2]MCY1023761.1 hypothetical protein [Pyxidicoccus sp. MSG2]